MRVGETVEVKVPGIAKKVPVRLRSETKDGTGFWAWCMPAGHVIFVPNDDVTSDKS